MSCSPIKAHTEYSLVKQKLGEHPLSYPAQPQHEETDLVFNHRLEVIANFNAELFLTELRHGILNHLSRHAKFPSN